MEADPKSRGLGRGLDALFSDEEASYLSPDMDVGDPLESAEVEVEVEEGPRRRDVVGIEQLRPGSLQPRQDFDEEALEQLAASIREHGLLQPLVVRPDPSSENQFEIIAGERRWRAAQRAQLHEVPIIIHALTDTEALEIALIENLQREDLNPVEEAQGYKKLIDDFGHSQEKVAQALGKSRSHVANMVRLLNLPESVQGDVRAGKLSMGHARALITSDSPEDLAREVIARGLSVRETEELVSGIREDSQSAEPEVERSGINPGAYSYVPRDDKPAKAKGSDVDTLALEEELSNSIGMKVRIMARKGGKGSMKIEYKSLDQLDDLIARLKSEGQASKLSA